MTRLRSESATYIAWGLDQSGMPGQRWWLAEWSDDGPREPERYYDSRADAQGYAELIAEERGLVAVECDEFGPLAAPGHPTV